MCRPEDRKEIDEDHDEDELAAGFDEQDERRHDAFAFGYDEGTKQAVLALHTTLGILLALPNLEMNLQKLQDFTAKLKEEQV